MIIKHICKKCGASQYSIVTVPKKEKIKYYKVCDNCKKKNRLLPNRTAYSLYHKLCEAEATLATNSLHDDKEWGNNYFKFLEKVKKEYKYVYDNLIVLIQYIYHNNYHRKFNSKFSIGSLMDVLKSYKEPLNEEMCISVFEELDKIVVVR